MLPAKYTYSKKQHKLYRAINKTLNKLLSAATKQQRINAHMEVNTVWKWTMKLPSGLTVLVDGRERKMQFHECGFIWETRMTLRNYHSSSSPHTPNIIIAPHPLLLISREGARSIWSIMGTSPFSMELIRFQLEDQKKVPFPSPSLWFFWELGKSGNERRFWE